MSNRLPCIKILILFYLCLGNQVLFGQTIKINGGLLLKTQLIFGNQNQSLKLGLSGFGTFSFNQVALESGFSIAGYSFLKKHNIKRKGIAYQYEVFGLAGVGNNHNLLGAAVSNLNNTFVFDAKGQGGFTGLGFGFEKEYLPGDLKIYGIRRGKFIFRHSDDNYSFHLNFLNDFQIGKLFYGQASDFAETGSLHIGFTQINQNRLDQYGLAFSIFTPKPDYSKSPRNKINSSDGRKNVWFTLAPFEDAFYGNLYAFASHQRDFHSVHYKFGVNSQKLGAYVQNKLHDGFGLNPRYPWNVSTKDKVYYEVGGSVFKTFIDEE